MRVLVSVAGVAAAVAAALSGLFALGGAAATLVGTAEFNQGGTAGATLIIFDTRGAQEVFLGGRDVFTTIGMPTTCVGTETVVRAARIKKESVQTVIRTEEARRVPGTQGDTLKVVQNLPGVARSALGSQQAQAAEGKERTDFSELNATFAIKNGVAHNDDLDVKAPLFRVGGAGDIDVAKSTINYVVKAAVVAKEGAPAR